MHRNARASSFTLAAASGRLSAVHASHSPRLGSVVAVDAKRLRDGTYLAGRMHVFAGHRLSRVRLSGTVTYVSSRSRTFAISARGVSILVRLRGARVASAAAAQLPAPGTNVTVVGKLGADDDVTATSVEAGGQDQSGIDLEGTVLSIDTSARTLSISADDEDTSSGAVTVAVPSSFDLSQDLHAGSGVG